MRVVCRAHHWVYHRFIPNGFHCICAVDNPSAMQASGSIHSQPDVVCHPGDSKLEQLIIRRYVRLTMASLNNSIHSHKYSIMDLFRWFAGTVPGDTIAPGFAGGPESGPTLHRAQYAAWLPPWTSSSRGHHHCNCRCIHHRIIDDTKR